MVFYFLATVGLWILQLSGISVEAVYHAHVPRRRAKALRDAFYDALARRLSPDIPWLHAPVITPGPDAPSLRSFQTRVAMAPYLAFPWTFLSRPALRLWLATHLGLAVFAPEQRCSYVPVSSGRSCQAALGSHSHHVHHCAHGPRLRRHNQLCRTWTLLLRRAGWHVQTEQNIPLLGGDAKRADLVAVSPTGVTTVCDLQVTSTVDHSLPTAPSLQTAAQNKARLYSTTPGGPLPDARCFVPLIHSADRPWLHESTLRFLHTLCLQTAATTCPADPPLGPPLHFSASSGGS